MLSEGRNEIGNEGAIALSRLRNLKELNMGTEYVQYRVQLDQRHGSRCHDHEPTKTAVALHQYDLP